MFLEKFLKGKARNIAFFSRFFVSWQIHYHWEEVEEYRDEWNDEGSFVFLNLILKKFSY